MKKLDEGQTMVCYVCHKEGHKSYECKVKNGGGAKKKEKNKKQTSKLSNTYTNKVDKKGLHTLSLEEEEKWQGGGHQGEQASQQWGQTHLGAKGDHFQHEEWKHLGP